MHQGGTTGTEMRTVNDLLAIGDTGMNTGWLVQVGREGNTTSEHESKQDLVWLDGWFEIC